MSLGLALKLSTAPLSKGVGRHDFRNGMPFESTYTRTGAATALTVAGLIQTFAADAPQRTDRGLALEPAATNLFTYWDPTVAQLSITGSTTDATAPASPPLSGRNWLTLDNTAGLAYAYLACSSIAANAAVVIQMLVETPDGSQPVFGLVSTAANDFSINMVSGNSIVSPVASYQRQSGNVWLVRIVGNAPASGASTFAGPIRTSAMNTRALKFSGFDIKLGAAASSPVIAAGAATTRGLPVFTEPVPGGRTKALLTYADATTTLVTGLTPGGTFDVATAVIGASKGRFGTSELVTREWQT